jgi:hypothetical protein
MAWYRQVRAADWATPADVKRSVGSASTLNDGRAVFNIAGNKYRIVVWINYPYRVVYLLVQPYRIAKTAAGRSLVYRRETAATFTRHFYFGSP